MARIRTIKPEFFRHEKLQDLENEFPGHHLMLVFIGLWTLCDNQGVFDYRPRYIRLDILPFIDFDIQESLDLLEGHGFFRRFESEGAIYGHIPSLVKHQRFSGKESGEDGARFPAPTSYLQLPTRETPGEATGKRQGSNGEAPSCPGKERKGIRKGKEFSDLPREAMSPVPASPATAVAVVSGEKALYDAIWETFLSKTEHFSNYGKEGAATKKLVSLFMVRDDPEATAKAVILRYYELTQGGDKFWSKQPFLPSSLLSLFDRVLKDLEVDRPLAAEDFIFDEAIPL